jgi:hypothetical protein
MVQTKVGSHLGAGVNLLFAFANAFENISRQIVIFQVVKTILDHLAQVKSFGPSGLDGKIVKTLLSFRGESYRCWHL